MQAPTPNTLQIELERTPPPCDQCGHPSLVVVELPQPLLTGRRRGIFTPVPHLSFCGHHFSVHEPLLAITGWSIAADVRAQLATREAARRMETRR